MAFKLFEYNMQAYKAASAMLSEKGRAAIIQPTGTGKSFIGFRLCEDNPEKTVLWLSPSEYVFRIQLENWIASGGRKLENIRFLSYTHLPTTETIQGLERILDEKKE